METVLTIDGLVAEPRQFTFQQLRDLPEEVQIRDVGSIVPGKQGDALSLRKLLEFLGAQGEQFWVTFHASRDDFAASIPNDPKVIETGIVLYSDGEQPIPLEKGGPVRFLIPNPAACHTAELDQCANVKFLDRIEITAERGRDTRQEGESIQ